MNPITIDHLTKRYAGFTLDDVSLTIPTGYITGFVGANGAGKTTTVKAALGMIRPDSGSVTTWDKERIGVVLDTPPFNPQWRIGDMTKALAAFYPVWSGDVLAEQLDRGGIRADHMVKDLSRGMGMRLQMGLALAHAPDLLILDEPTSGLDPLGRSELRDDLAEFITDERHAVWFSTHITSDLERLADNLVIISRGRIIADGPLDEVRAGFVKAQGTPDQLTSHLRRIAHGLVETAVGWEALVTTNDATQLSASIVCSEPTIEEIVVAVAKEAHHD